MIDRLKTLKTHWNQLNEREQIWVGLGGLGGVLLLFYLLIYQPLVVAVAEQQSMGIEKKSTLIWLQQARASFSREHMPQPVTTATLLSVLTNLLNHVSFKRFPYQLEQTSNGDIQLTFAAVPYNLFIPWLQTQSRQYAWTIKNLNVNRSNKAGVVKVSVVFTAAENAQN